MNTLFGQHRAVLGTFQQVLWSTYLVAAVVLPLCHVRPILKYLRGTSGIGDACIRTEAVQCLWRVPALLFSMFVAPSLPLFLSIFLDLVGRIGRVLAMSASQRRWQAARVPPGYPVDHPGGPPAAASRRSSADQSVVVRRHPSPPRPSHLKGSERTEGTSRPVRKSGPNPAYKPSVESDTPFVTLPDRPRSLSS